MHDDEVTRAMSPSASGGPASAAARTDGGRPTATAVAPRVSATGPPRSPPWGPSRLQLATRASAPTHRAPPNLALRIDTDGEA